MSAIYVYRIKPTGRLDEIGEAHNSSAFLNAIWHHLLLKHNISGRWTLELPVLNAMWQQVAKLPRVDGLLCAATFDRAWFPMAMIPELCAAFDTAVTFAPTCLPIAMILRGTKRWGNTRGVCFGSSLCNTWNCWGADGDDDDVGLHVVGKGGHKCKTCGKQLQRVDHVLRDKACCWEARL